MGYCRAGFEVIGVDIDPQPHYPFEFIQADAVAHLDSIIETGEIGQYDLIAASPPCQAFTKAQRIQKNDHPDLIGPIRALLLKAGVPYVIENVPGAPLEGAQMLCGAMFGLRTYRHRLFESSFPWDPPEHPEHVARTAKMGRPVKSGEFMHIVGNFNGAALAKEIMEMPWATRDTLREAIPPAYTEWIGQQFIEWKEK